MAKILTLTWNKAEQAAGMDLEATEDEDLSDGYELLRIAVEQQPWVHIPLPGKWTPPERMMQFLVGAFKRIGYVVVLGEGCVSRRPQQAN